MTPEVEKAYRAACAADNDWQKELKKIYGKKAGDARFDQRGYATPELDNLWKLKREADKVWQITIAASRKLPDQSKS